ncbi:hypothetical protein BT69DRAFT_1278380 [Atractiella rhizophila]|nr:hypothetical protein BT69DRAFT_1278380 [Atractiella rhizophila]
MAHISLTISPPSLRLMLPPSPRPLATSPFPHKFLRAPVPPSMLTVNPTVDRGHRRPRNQDRHSHRPRLTEKLSPRRDTRPRYGRGRGLRSSRKTKPCRCLTPLPSAV